MHTKEKIFSSLILFSAITYLFQNPARSKCSLKICIQDSSKSSKPDDLTIWTRETAYSTRTWPTLQLFGYPSNNSTPISAWSSHRWLCCPSFINYPQKAGKLGFRCRTNSWGAYLTHQSGPGLQVLPTTPSLYLLQSLVGTPHPLPWTFQVRDWFFPPPEVLPYVMQTFCSLPLFLSLYLLSRCVCTLFLTFSSFSRGSPCRFLVPWK